MTGPISPGPVPGLILEAFSNTVLKRASWLGPCPTVIKTDAAMHRCPAHPAKETTISDAAPSISQSGRAMRWFLAPPKAVTRLFSDLHRLATIEATGEDPTKVTARTSLWSIIASTASLVPWTMLKTPSGIPALVINPTTLFIVSGTFSLGLSTTVLPVTSAMGTVHIGTMKGKLNGTMLATTPTGSRRSSHDTSELTLRL
mmetsp:Transcript_20067/g.40679  ORF Transcript_20067/g.40679 Transcript_20067/m.40679 type:complete len:201 (+) Transcript_20067:820-1422(+)